MKKVIVCLADGFEEIEAISIVDILRRAEIHTVTVSVSDSKQVTGAHNVQVAADELFNAVDFSDSDMIVLPGGMPGAQNLNSHKELREKIAEFNEKGKFLGAICAAPLVFGELGILENRRATCYPGFGSFLKQARLSDDAVVEDKNIITGNGPGAAFDFGLKLVEKLRGKEVAAITAKKMMIG